MSTAQAFASYEDAEIDVPEWGGVNRKAFCPQCRHDRKPANRRDRPLSIDVERGLWHCHNCGWSGFLKRDDRAPRQAAPHRTFTRPERGPDDLHPDAVSWFEERGISEQVVRRNKITATRHEIAFPFFRDGIHVNTQLRTYPNKGFRMVAGAELTFFGLDDAAGCDEWVITEGMLDKLAIEQATGDIGVVSVPNGAGSNLDAVLAPLEERLKSVKRFILAGDTDADGATLTEELARRLGRHKCSVVAWPEWCKDANDVLLTYGAEVLGEFLMDATPYPIVGVVRPLDLFDAVLRLQQRGDRLGVEPMGGALGELVRLEPGYLMTVSGVPGSGKSRLVDNWVVHTAFRHGWRWAVCSPESWPPQLYLKHLLQIHLGRPLVGSPGLKVNGRWVQEPVEGMSRDQIYEGLAQLNRRIALVTPEPLTMPNVVETMVSVALRDGVQGIVLDPWNRLGHRKPNGTSMTDYVGEQLANLKEIAQRNGVLPIVVAHPRKPEFGRDKTGIIRVQPYDIADSHNFFDMSDFVATVARDKLLGDGEVEVHVGKVKTEEYGRVGSVTMHYDPPTGRFGDHPWS